MLTRHFAQNFVSLSLAVQSKDADIMQGAPYKFSAPVASKTFAESPDAVLMGAVRLTWAGQALTEAFDDIIDHSDRAPSCPTSDFIGFNELLLLGYMEGDCINVSTSVTAAPTTGYCSDILMFSTTTMESTSWDRQWQACLSVRLPSSACALSTDVVSRARGEVRIHRAWFCALLLCTAI